MDSLELCRDECEAVSWTLVFYQVVVASVPWSVLTILGSFITCAFPQWSSSERRWLMAYDCGLASRSIVSCMVVLFIHVCQCAVFAIRAATLKVSPVYHAVEILCTLVIYIDMLFGWAHNISRGSSKVLVSAFDTMIVDSLVSTAVVSIMVAGPDGEHTWFSFSFLASLRMLRILLRAHVIQESMGRTGSGVRIVYHLLVLCLFVYLCGTLLMVLERLGEPIQEDQEGRWGLFSSMLFVVSTITTVGDTRLKPLTVLGRLFAVWLICWSFYLLLSKVGHLVVDFLSGKSLGLGHFKPTLTRTAGPHVVVVGSPTAPMLWDFLSEVYHPNHYASGDAFDREAPEIVILVPSIQTLAHLRQFLARRESMLFRGRVTPLHGEPFESSARERAALDTAKQIVVLPNLSTADVVGDDAVNIMRTFALCSAVPHVRTICLLHRLEHRPSTLEARDGNGQFISIDAFKLALLAKACLTPGVLSFVSNLYRAVGDSPESTGDSWQVEYEKGLGCEIYEADLSVAYEGATFYEVATDVVARSEKGNVYFIGIVDHNGDVIIHPGCQTRISVAYAKMTGIFLASEAGDIVQCKPGDYLLGPLPQELRRSSLRASLQAAGVGDPPPSDPVSPKSSNLGESLKLLESLTVPEVYVPTAAEIERAKATKGYEVAMKDIGHTLLARGLNTGIVAEITASLEKDYGDPPKGGHQLTRGSTSPTTRGSTPFSRSRSPTKAPRSAKRERPDASNGFGETEGRLEQFNVIEKGSKLFNVEEERMGKLRRYYAIQRRMVKDARHPPDPPPALLKMGGHILLCIVSDTSCEGNTNVAVGDFGPSMGIEHFTKPLRDSRLKMSGSQPVLVVLAESLPSDWHTVAEDDRLYFVRGSPLDIGDLERAGFRSAAAIAIARHHSGEQARLAKLADARAILATSLIESHLEGGTRSPVVTDLAYDASCEFLPLSQAAQIARTQMRPRPPRRASGTGGGGSGLPSALTGGILGALLGGSKKGSSSQEGQSGRDSEALRSAKEASELQQKLYEEDYEKLEVPDYAQHPRFMCGQVFITAAMTALVANTLHSPSLVPLVGALLRAPFMLLHLPLTWQGQTYADLCDWLLQKRNLLAVGLYRSSTGSSHETLNEEEARPSLHYMYTAPCAYDTYIHLSDRVLCIAPSGDL
mmetsp:Transcript_97981/g.169715  ORF Transcript_97981/g.169715 Transcript_97981/m.169715 type:complete len:1160 (+) Transcript_97981:77-3556(+)